MRLGGGTHAQRGADAVNRKPSNSVSTLAVPRKAVTVAVDGKLSSRAKRSIFLKVGKSANRVQRINRQALRFSTEGLARLYPDNPSTSVQHPSALSDCNCGANWTRAGM